MRQATNRSRLKSITSNPHKLFKVILETGSICN